MDNMGIKLEDLDLLDLLNDKHFKLKKTNEQRWDNAYNISITNSEWYIISLIYGKQPTISEITQHIDISRQATHKCIKALSTKGLIIINNVENNNRNKCLKLTPLGEKCFSDNELIKKSIEREIIIKLGSENVVRLKNLLDTDWV